MLTVLTNFSGLNRSWIQVESECIARQLRTECYRFERLEVEGYCEERFSSDQWSFVYISMNQSYYIQSGMIASRTPTTTRIYILIHVRFVYYTFGACVVSMRIHTLITQSYLEHYSVICFCVGWRHRKVHALVVTPNVFDCIL